MITITVTITTMPLSEPMSPAALEALYKVVIRDTLDQSLHRRNADDLTKQRQAATAAEKRLGLVERTVQGLDEALGELRGTTAGLKAAVQQLHAAQQEQAAAADKKTIRALEKQLRQVDQRQGELENAHEEVQKAFQHTAQTMNQCECAARCLPLRRPSHLCVKSSDYQKHTLPCRCPLRSNNSVRASSLRTEITRMRKNWQMLASMRSNLLQAKRMNHQVREIFLHRNSVKNAQYGRAHTKEETTTGSKCRPMKPLKSIPSTRRL